METQGNRIECLRCAWFFSENDYNKHLSEHPEHANYIKCNKCNIGVHKLVLSVHLEQNCKLIDFPNEHVEIPETPPLETTDEKAKLLYKRWHEAEERVNKVKDEISKYLGYKKQ